MIKIERIKPINLNTAIKTLDDLIDTYFNKSKQYYSPLKILTKLVHKEEVIVDKKSIKMSSFNKNEQKIIRFLYQNYKELIIGKPDKLEKIIQKIDETVLGEYKNNGAFGSSYVLNEFGNIILAIFGYEEHFRSLESKGIWYAENLNIKACPYCNSQYTLVVTKKSKKKQAKFQFDHFFSKKRYPYLSISMFNLIPSCANCNLAKGNKKFTLNTHYHPYYSDLNNESTFSLNIDLNIDKLTIAELQGLKIEVEFKSINTISKNLVDDHDAIFNISGIYRRFTDEARFILHRAIINNKASQRATKEIKGLFPDDYTYLEYLMGNLPFKEEISNRPLTKLAQDLANKYKLL